MEHQQPPQETPQPQQPTEQLSLLAQSQNGAGWFIWIAGLSVVTSLLWHFGAGISFIFGLGITQFIDAIAMGIIEETGNTVVKYIALALDIMVAGIFVLFWVFAKKNHTWAFIVGMVLYAIDGLLFLIVGDFLSLAVHGFALFCIFKGLKACMQLNGIERNQTAQVLTTETYHHPDQVEIPDDNIYSQ